MERAKVCVSVCVRDRERDLFIVYTLPNLSVVGLCLRINDSGLFAWISALSRTYFMV